MKNLLSSIGIGAATVDTILPSGGVVRGESIEARVEVEGGSTEQEIDSIYFALVTQYEADDYTSTVVIDKFELLDPFVIGPGETLTQHVTINVPYSTPLTMGKSKVWLKTGLDIEWAVDPNDEDWVEVKPGPLESAFFEAVDDLGFSLYSAECEADPRDWFGNGQPFVQELEFVPRGGPFSGRLDELEVVLMPSEDEVTAFLEIDRAGGGLFEAFDLDERMVGFSFGEEDVPGLKSELQRVIAENS